MINNEEIEKINEELLQDKNNKIMHRILNKVSLNDLITDQDTVLKNDFNININKSMFYLINYLIKYFT